MSNPRRNNRFNQQRFASGLYSHPLQYTQYRQSPHKYTIKVQQPSSNKIIRREALDQQSYLLSLEQQIQTLRSKMQGTQQRRQKLSSRGFRPQDQLLDPNKSRPQSIQSRRSNAGKFYSKGQPSFSSGKVKHSEQSSFYKWAPQIQPQQPKINQNSNNSPQTSVRKLSYRVKSIKSKDQKKIKTQNTVFKQEQKIKIKNIPAVQQIEQLKHIFTSNCEWQINSIQCDFRYKITKKLQIPIGFPLKPPSMNQTIQQLHQQAYQIYQLFQLKVDKFKEKLVVRRFKNGIYYQMKPNKNIVWYFSGAFYFGDWDTDLPSEAEKNGFGFEYIPNKHYYLGQFKNGRRNGKGVIKIINNGSSNQFVAYDCEWLDGKPHGQGKQIDQKNNKYIGAFQNGQKTGKAIVLNSDGLYYQGELLNGIKEGEGVQKLINGDVYTGSFHEQKFHGQGSYVWKNGSIYQGQFKNGIRQGKGLWKSYNGDQFEGHYSNDVKQGWGKFTWKNGQIYEGQFKNDMRDGLGYYKHPNGKVGKYLWKEGHIDHRIIDQEQQRLYTQKKKGTELILA